ncbi:MAG: hypothetical protein A2905_05130 [Candidatus Levybacteria bacterium RIFCSPLOWO2_01_FULL_36_10]|nr:MAG: hypothetical protein A2905_05130 [Candidatus Levybacteria bacterium RIFCSPLOWO2_01_FULL_36_10]
MNRKAVIDRKTNETDISISLNIDGIGKRETDIPVGFLTHMLDLFAKHGLFDLSIKAKGDTYIDEHHTVEDIRNILLAGADKVSLNTPAVNNPKFIIEASKAFGSQCIVLAIDAKKENDRWKVFINGGRTATEFNVINWAKEAVQKGAGEILLTSMDKDGTKNGYDIELTKAISESVNVPVIASGGGGKIEDFSNVFQEGKADAALAASLFHFRELTIQEVKDYLEKLNIQVRN